VLTGAVLPPSGDARPVPHPVLLADDWVEQPGCELRGSAVVRYCDRPGEHDREVLVVGDSHTQQLGAVVTRHAGEQDFGVRTALLGACPFTLDPAHLADDRSGSCLDHNRAVLSDVAQDPPDLVVTVGSRAAVDSPGEEVPDGYAAAWRELTDLGVLVLVLRDNPRWSESPVECVLREDADACSRPTYDTYPDVDPLARAVEDEPDVAYLDTSRLLCDAEQCAPVVGGMYVYMDSNHVSRTYVRTMAEAAGPELRRLVPWWR
jgi:SGNH domain (fused to AT3 domains)